MNKLLLTSVLVLAAHATGLCGVTLASATEQPAASPAPQASDAPKQDDRPDAAATPAPAAPAQPATRHCTTLSGEKFEWSFPNVPFGTASCS
ncbi:hypothetical protein IC762_15235 [Bradyrhizobium genosp. L]|uniref:hypothetical protein n=1 Tax=Bradyrhizobium genosp. L TaxID=83637 RepID=UPI0018A3169B|nr:hypothetical protein [Bradyrhizobium genosp. L]QPF87554.1 hypothetical protein IC762_15235 [Bradyrhizobium genosp. L]